MVAFAKRPKPARGPLPGQRELPLRADLPPEKPNEPERLGDILQRVIALRGLDRPRARFRRWR
jgi:hypothetical protein